MNPQIQHMQKKKQKKKHTNCFKVTSKHDLVSTGLIKAYAHLLLVSEI